MCIKMLKSKIVVATLASSLAFSNVNASGIPVIDTSALAQQVISYAETISQNAKVASRWIEENTQWAKQLAHYAQEIQAYKDQLIATSGIKDTIVAYQSLDNLYTQSLAAYDRTKELIDDPAGAAKKAFSKEWDQYMKYDRCKQLAGEEARACYSEFSRMVSDLGTQKEALEYFKKKTEDKLPELDSKVKQSKDIKESTDVGNTIALEHYQLALKEAQIRADKDAREAKEKLEIESAQQRLINAQFSERVDNLANRRAAQKAIAEQYGMEIEHETISKN